MLLKNFFSKLLVLFLLTSCSQFNPEQTQEILDETVLSTSTTIVEQAIETSTTTTTSIVEECKGENNLSTDFTEIKNVQIFLNKYGFNAGDEDGYLGNQTINAIREFQRFAGLYPDGDVGPITRDTMNKWTGCEEKSSFVQDTTTTTQPNKNEDDSDTTSTTTSSTTTTVPINTETVVNDNFGYFPSVSLISNQIQTIIKGVNNSDSICGTPFYNNLDSGILNFYENGNSEVINYLSNKFQISSATTEIKSISNDKITIQVNGNGDDAYKFYFIEPFSSKIISLTPDNVKVSPGLTEVEFNKSNLKNGYWFYTFAENGSGEIVKSSGLREFSIDPIISQFRDSQSNVEKIFFTTNSQFISSGQNLSSTDSVEISYITDQIYTNKDNTTSAINSSDSVISLSNDNQANTNELLLINNEIMYILSKNGSQYTVERGYLNTIPSEHATSTPVKKIREISEPNLISDFAYLIIRNEEGLRFQVPLSSELLENKFTLSGCPNGRYSFEQITTFGWREQGSSVVSSSTNKNLINSIFNKEFVITNSSINYLPPDLKGLDSNSGTFLNNGPRNITISTGDTVTFNFQGLQTNSSDVKFVKLNFQMIPTDSSKLTKTKSVFQNVDSANYNFEINFRTLINSPSPLSDVWEKGYKYIFTGIEIFDSFSKTTFENNGNVIYDSGRAQTQHDAYYLDQFSFLVPNN